MDDFDPRRYGVTIKRVSLDRGECFEASVAELPQIVEYADTADSAYAAAVDSVWSALDEAVDRGVKLPDPNPSRAADQLPVEEPQELAEPVEAVVDPWPKLEKPARVGTAEFAIGVSARLVVLAAQRAFQWAGEHRDLTPEQAEAEERARRALWDARNGPLTG